MEQKIRQGMLIIGAILAIIGFATQEDHPTVMTGVALLGILILIVGWFSKETPAQVAQK